MVNEYNRIVSTTQFNGHNLIDGTLTNLSIQSGYGQSGSLDLSIGQGLQQAVGTGTFNAPISSPQSSASLDAVGVDLNSDGNLDLVSSKSNAIGVSFGNGDGTVKSTVTYTCAGVGSLAGITSGDFNGDGLNDIAAASYGTASVAIFYGNGDASFKAGISYVTAARNEKIVAHTFGDGRLDLVTAGIGTNHSTILYGNADGSFASPVTLTTQAGAFSVVVADINNDGRADLLFADGLTAKSIDVFLGNGDGTFRASYTIGFSAVSANAAGLALADLNGDGQLDMVVSDSAGVGALFTAFGNGDGTFAIGKSYAAPATANISLKVDDFNGDGCYDVALASNGSPSIYVYLGKGDGSFASPQSFSTPAASYGLVDGDFNGDGVLDLVSTSTVSVLLANTGTSSFLPVLNLNNQS